LSQGFHQDDPSPADAIAAEAAQILEAVAVRERHAAFLNKQLRLAFYDLGLLDLVGRDWVRIGADGFEFGPLEDKQVDKVLARLRDLAERRPDPVGLSGPGQLGLDFDPQPSPPPAMVPGSSLHLAGDR
jgi:hypothetical protein